MWIDINIYYAYHIYLFIYIKKIKPFFNKIILYIKYIKYIYKIPFKYIENKKLKEEIETEEIKNFFSYILDSLNKQNEESCNQLRFLIKNNINEPHKLIYKDRLDLLKKYGYFNKKNK